MPELVYTVPPAKRRTRYAYDEFNNGGIYRLAYSKDFHRPSRQAASAIYGEARRLDVCVKIRMDHHHKDSRHLYECLMVQFLWDLPYVLDEKPDFREIRPGDDGPYPWGPHVRTRQKLPPDHDVSDEIRAYLAAV